MNDPVQSQVFPDPRVERRFRKVVETSMQKWRAARAKATNGWITTTEEFEMRRCITELERARRNLPLDIVRQQPISSVEWNVRTYLDAQQSQIMEPPWKIKGLVVEGGATQVSAHPHGMKSLSWLNAALESVTIHTVWRHFDASKVERVLFIESEDPEWLVAARVRGLAKGLGLNPNEPVPGFHYACPGPFDFVKEELMLRELFAKYKPDFVVLSTLQSMLAGRDWLTQKDMQPVNALIVRLSRFCPLVVLTHSPWNKAQRRAAGTITQFANFAIALHYEKMKVGDTDTIHVKVDSKVGGSVEDFYLELQTEGDKDDSSSVRGLVYGGEGRPRGAGRDAVLEALGDDPDASAEEIARRVGVSSRYVREIKKDERGGGRGHKRKPRATQVDEVDPNDPRLTSPSEPG